MQIPTTRRRRVENQSLLPHTSSCFRRVVYGGGHEWLYCSFLYTFRPPLITQSTPSNRETTAVRPEQTRQLDEAGMLLRGSCMNFRPRAGMSWPDHLLAVPISCLNSYMYSTFHARSVDGCVRSHPPSVPSDLTLCLAVPVDFAFPQQMDKSCCTVVAAVSRHHR